MDLFIAICSDHRIIELVRVFSTPEKAIKYCKKFVPAGYQIEEQELTPEMIYVGWIYYATYGVEGDNIRVEKRILDAPE